MDVIHYASLHQAAALRALEDVVVMTPVVAAAAVVVVVVAVAVVSVLVWLYD